MQVETLFTPEAIGQRLREIAREVDAWIGEDEVTVVACLKGAFIFCADFVRLLASRKVSVDFLTAESYSGQSHTGSVRLTQDLSTDVRGRKVLLMDDILDTGLTLEKLLRHIEGVHRPSEIRLFVLLDKPSGRKTQVTADWTGFTVGNGYVIGYGMDCDGIYRNLPGIAVLGRSD